ncbi:hypothetical protein FPOA_05165 [Fusarium poae]|uniref:Uncharacterized protein n=1 Tax=Fusarium poae TaxID=36050 RepID=A0A1B8AVS1_FUSPO|nr:hypothetical protein FPOA_05165 [Fusarium poae]
MTLSNSAEKSTSTHKQPITTETDNDDWEIVNGKGSELSDDQANKERDSEKGTEESSKGMAEDERKRELTKAKWEGMQQQAGGVYPHREVQVPTYPKFTGDW